MYLVRPCTNGFTEYSLKCSILLCSQHTYSLVKTPHTTYLEPTARDFFYLIKGCCCYIVSSGFVIKRSWKRSNYHRWSIKFPHPLYLYFVEVPKVLLEEKWSVPDHLIRDPVRARLPAVDRHRIPFAQVCQVKRVAQTLVQLRTGVRKASLFLLFLNLLLSFL